MAGGKASPTKANETSRRREALALRIRGKTFDQIGDAMGITRQSAHELVHAALNAARTETKQLAADVVELECARLDAMIAGLWDVAIAEPPSDLSEEAVAALYDKQLATIDRVVKLMDRRAKYLGLDVSKTEISGPDGSPVTLDVVNGLRAKLARFADTGAEGSTATQPDPSGSESA